MVTELFMAELLGKNWFVDERLGEFRSVSNVGEPIIFIKNREMDDILTIDEIVNNRDNFEVDDETVSKLKKLVDSAVEGDRDAIEDISKICNQDGEE